MRKIIKDEEDQEADEEGDSYEYDDDAEGEEVMEEVEVEKMDPAGNLDKNVRVIDYNFNYFEKVIGLHLSSEDQIKTLESLLFKINKITDKS